MPVGVHDITIDRQLAEISGLLPLLRYVTPVNVAEARAAFWKGEVAEPAFEYRPLPDLGEISDRLADVDPEVAEDAAVGHMAANLKRELEVRLDLLAARGSPRFFLASVELFGHVEDSLHELAAGLLDLPPHSGADSYMSAGEFAEIARREVDSYRRSHPEMSAVVMIDETRPGVMVENGDMYIGADTRVPFRHAPCLIHHEVGVHMLTYANGSAQPLRMLAAGLAGYEETQEALGVLAEYLGGGLSRKRLRVLAYRVMAARLRSDQAGFRQTYRSLIDQGASRRLAFSTTMRAYRSGGMTKDAIYLRGLARLLDHLAAGGDLENLFVGKVALADVPLVTELRQRGVLTTPPLRPHFLDVPDASQRLAAIAAGLSVQQLGEMSS